MTPSDRVYLNLSIDDYRPDPMVFDPVTKTYSLDRMAPSVVLDYYFTVNGHEKYLLNQEKRTPKDTSFDLVFVNVLHNTSKNRRRINHEYIKRLD